MTTDGGCHQESFPSVPERPAILLIKQQGQSSCLHLHKLDWCILRNVLAITSLHREVWHSFPSNSQSVQYAVPHDKTHPPSHTQNDNWAVHSSPCDLMLHSRVLDYHKGLLPALRAGITSFLPLTGTLQANSVPTARSLVSTGCHILTNNALHFIQILLEDVLSSFVTCFISQ